VILRTRSEAGVRIVSSEKSVGEKKYILPQLNVWILLHSDSKFNFFFVISSLVFLTPDRLVYSYQCFGLASWPRLNSVHSLELAR